MRDYYVRLLETATTTRDLQDYCYKLYARLVLSKMLSWLFSRKKVNDDSSKDDLHDDDQLSDDLLVDLQLKQPPQGQEIEMVPKSQPGEADGDAEIECTCKSRKRSGCAERVRGILNIITLLLMLLLIQNYLSKRGRYRHSTADRSRCRCHDEFEGDFRCFCEDGKCYHSSNFDGHAHSQARDYGCCNCGGLTFEDDAWGQSGTGGWRGSYSGRRGNRGDSWSNLRGNWGRSWGNGSNYGRGRWGNHKYGWGRGWNNGRSNWKSGTGRSGW